MQLHTVSPRRCGSTRNQSPSMKRQTRHPSPASWCHSTSVVIPAMTLVIHHRLLFSLWIHVSPIIIHVDSHGSPCFPRGDHRCHAYSLVLHHRPCGARCRPVQTENIWLVQAIGLLNMYQSQTMWGQLSISLLNQALKLWYSCKLVNVLKVKLSPKYNLRAYPFRNTEKKVNNLDKYDSLNSKVKS